VSEEGITRAWHRIAHVCARQLELRRGAEAGQ